MDELSSHLAEEGIAASRLARTNNFLASHHPAPIPAQFTFATVNHTVEVLCTDSDGAKQTKQFVLGGEDEPELYRKQGITVLFYQSPVGARLIRKEVGHEFELMLEGVVYEAEIIAIKPLPEADTQESRLGIAA